MDNKLQICRNVYVKNLFGVPSGSKKRLGRASHFFTLTPLKNHSKYTFLIILFFIILNPNSLFAMSLDETLNSLSSVSSIQSVQFRWDPLFRDGVFNIGDNYGTFSVAAKEGETGFLIFNNRELFNVTLPYNDNGRLVFPESFVATLRTTFTRLSENDSSRFRIAAIVIDPGHGGRDPGAVGSLPINGRNTQINEKDIVLRVATALRDQLIRTYPDKRILMTRDSDRYLTLDQRSDMANSVTVRDNESVIFISIHANAARNTSARGYEVWHITSGGRPRQLLDSSMSSHSPDIQAILNRMLNEEFTSESILLANSILQGFEGVFGNTLPSRGPKANDWFVVKNSHMPAVLVELGFLTNRQDAQIMTSEEGLQRLTRSLYNGITDFIGIFEKK